MLQEGGLGWGLLFATWNYLHGAQYRSPTSKIFGISRISRNRAKCEELPPPGSTTIVWNQRVLGCLERVWTLLGAFFFGDRSLISGFKSSGPGTDFDFFWFFKSLGFWVNLMTNEVDEVYRFQGYPFSRGIYIAT